MDNTAVYEYSHKLLSIICITSKLKRLSIFKNALLKEKLYFDKASIVECLSFFMLFSYPSSRSLGRNWINRYEIPFEILNTIRNKIIQDKTTCLNKLISQLKNKYKRINITICISQNFKQLQRLSN